MSSHSAILLVGLLLTAPPEKESEPPRPWERRPLDMRYRQLMLDDEVVVSTKDVRKVYPQAIPSGRVLLKAEEPWERVFGAGIVDMPCVLYDPDAKLYRLWYSTYAPGVVKGKEYAVMYAESKDALIWTRPHLGLHPFRDDGGKNNILTWDLIGHSVVPAAEPTAKYRFLGSHTYATGLSDDGRSLRDMRGLNFSPVPNADAIQKARGTFNSDFSRFLYDPVDKVYRAHVKTWSTLTGSSIPSTWRRAVAPAVSKDGVSWTFSGRVLQADLLDDASTAALAYRKEKDRPAWAELHDMPLYRYEGLLIGLMDLLQFYDRGVSRTYLPSDGINTIVYLAWSHDGNNWSRPVERQPFLAVDTAPGAAHHGFQMFAPSPPLRMGKELWLVYGVPEGAVNTGGKPLKPQWITYARLRVDGWAAYEAGRTGGVIETERFVAGGSLRVNADRSMGSLRVEVLEEVARPISATDRVFRVVEGFGRDDAVEIKGDGLGHEARWKGKTWAMLSGKTVRLRFHLQGGKVYSFGTRD